jgi:hypothetical protein
VAEPPLNLEDVAKGPKYIGLTESTYHVESSDEAAAKRHETSEQAKHKRRVHFIMLLFALFIVLLSFGWCIYVYSTGSVDDKKWSQTIAASICTGLLAYALRPLSS